MRNRVLPYASVLLIAYAVIVLFDLIDMLIVALHRGTIINETYENVAIMTQLASIVFFPFALYATRGLSAKGLDAEPICTSEAPRWQNIVYIIGYSACVVEAIVLAATTVQIVIREIT